MPTRISPLDYAFAVGRVRALEKFLIKEEVFLEAIDASLSEALELFTESGLYGEEFLHIKHIRDLEEALAQETDKLKKEIKGMLLDKRLRDLLEPESIERLHRIAGDCRSEFLYNYIMHLTDMHNIKTFLRLYVLREPLEELKKRIVRAGFIARETFITFYPQELPAFFNKLEYARKGWTVVSYAAYLREAAGKMEKERSFIALEKAVNDFLITVLRPAKYLSFGPEPVLAYYFARVNEMNLIRLIITAKLNGLPAELVKERLNAVYC